MTEKKKLERARGRTAWILVFVMFILTISSWVYALNPSFSTIIQPGTNISGYSYIIFTDGTSIFARNGNTGAIDYSGTTFSTVTQNAINAIGGVGSIFFAKQINPQPGHTVTFFGQNVPYDYRPLSTVNVPYGVSLFSNAAVFDVSGINSTVFVINSIASTTTNGFAETVSNFNVIGSLSNSNTTFIYILRTNRGIFVDTIITNFVSNPIVIVGEAYDSVIANSNFNQGVTAISGSKGAYTTGPNDLNIVNTAIQVFTTGITISDAYSVSAVNIYCEAVFLCVNGVDTISSSFIGPSIINAVGIKNPRIVSGNVFENAVTGISSILIT